MIGAIVGFVAAAVVSILFPEFWARFVEVTRRAVVVAQKVKIKVERSDDT